MVSSGVGGQKQSCSLRVGTWRTRQPLLFSSWNKPSNSGRNWNGAQMRGLGGEDEGYDFIKNPKTAVTGQSSPIPGGHGAVRAKLPGSLCFPFPWICAFLPFCHLPARSPPAWRLHKGRSGSNFAFKTTIEVQIWFVPLVLQLFPLPSAPAATGSPWYSTPLCLPLFPMHPQVCFNLLYNILARLPK